SNATNIYIRGVGQPDALQTFDPAVGVYVDDVYYSRIRGTQFDLLDLERQVLIELSGEAAPAPAAIGPGSVIVADDLLPSQLMALDAVKVAGLCTAQGGPTSHVAILAAAMGVPALVAVGAALD
ncbi:PEP-utilizing enzyme, partial [Mesorhizobium japonicum]|uniref:PEP-utilizing enzyme n=1 Tax=Mesorhizobium japonicum TaxID=2066070 RepID=UPI003B5AB2DB